MKIHSLSRLLSFISVVSLVVGLSACSVNPVTGKSQLSLLSAQDEVSIGSKNYKPMQQQQGGRYMIDPELNLYVQSVGKKLAQLSDRPNLPYEFVVLNNDTPNAWALPGGKIAINRGLLYELKDEAQLAAVLGHEIVHAAARHGATQQTQGMILGLGSSILEVAGEVYGLGDLANQGLALSSAAVQARYGQSQELESDDYGIQYMSKAGYDPKAAVELQETFVRLSAGRNQDVLGAFFASHPPSQTRVRKNREHASKLPSGVRNKSAFDRAMRQVRKDKPAYKKHMQALEAASQKQYAKALSSVGEAIRLQPRESLFWETKGKIQLQQQQASAAVGSFAKAIQNNPELFSPRLYQGIAYYINQQYAQAESSLKSSRRILDTQTTVFYLGEASLQLGKRAEAKQYFTLAQQGGGELGKKATEKLTTLQ